MPTLLVKTDRVGMVMDEPSDDDDDDDILMDEDEDPFERMRMMTRRNDETAQAFETDETAPTPVPSPRRHMARMSVRPQTPILLPSEAEVERLLALPIPPPSPLSPWSSLLPQIPLPPLPPPPSSLHLPLPISTSLPLPSSPLPPLPASLSVPPLVDRREGTPEAELPPRKRLCMTTPTSRNEVGESSTTAPRPTGGHRADYGFIGTMDAEIRLDVLTEDRQFHYETARLLDQEALVSREAWAHSVGLSLAVHYELQSYRTHTQMQDYHIASQESLTATLIAQVSLLQGQLSAALGQIHALQARDQTHADDPEGAEPLAATARAAAARACSAEQELCCP
ncbi:hypothetical protein Tco_0459202 [Tanacetum coccineum]